MKLGNKKGPSNLEGPFCWDLEIRIGAVGLSRIVELEGHEVDDLGQLMVGVKGFEPSTSSSRTTRAAPALHPDRNRILIP